MKYKGSLDCAIKLYKEGGIRSSYRGVGATLLRGEGEGPPYVSGRSQGGGTLHIAEGEGHHAYSGGGGVKEGAPCI